MNKLLVCFRSKFTLSALVLALLIGLLPAAVSAQTPTSTVQKAELGPIQQYDLSQEKIVKVVPNNASFQKEALSWLDSATELSAQLSINDKCGSIYKIPLEQEITKPFKGLTFVVKDIFLIYCPDKKPLLLVFSKDRKPYLLLFSADVGPFLKQFNKS